MYEICMSKIINVYLKDEVAEKMGNIENKSHLINELLEEHFNKKNAALMSDEELKKRLEILKLKQETENKIRELENGN